MYYDKGMNDGVERSLARRIRIGMTLIERKEFATVLEHEAQAIWDQPCSHSTIVRLDEGDHHAVGIGHRKVGGISIPLELRFARTKARRSALRINKRKPLLRILIRQERLK